MKTHHNCHDFTGRHSTTTLMFFGAVFEQLFLPLGINTLQKSSTSQNISTNLFMPVPF
jgi:hypothetical protein